MFILLFYLHTIDFIFVHSSFIFGSLALQLIFLIYIKIFSTHDFTLFMVVFFVQNLFMLWIWTIFI